MKNPARGSRHALLLVSAACLLGSAAVAADPPSCVDSPPDRKPTCWKEWLGVPPLDERALSRIDSLIPSAAAAALEVLDLVAAEHSSALEAAPGLAAAALDRRGEALWALSRSAESANALVAAVALDDGTLRLDWLSSDGSSAWSASLDPGDGRLERAARSLAAAGRREEARSLLARALALGARGQAVEADPGIGGLEPVAAKLTSHEWYPPLPSVEVQLFDGGTFAVPAAGAKALILDFWATWCRPCAEELPSLQRLYDRESERGLKVVTINMVEPPGLAQRFADELGLSMPIGHYDRTVEAAFEVQALPTLIVADRRGRIRARFSDYKPSLDEKVAELTRELLEESVESREALADVLRGAGSLEVRWTRELKARIEGIAPTARAEGATAIVAVAGRSLLVFDAEGAIVETRKSGAGAGLLRRGDLDGDGKPELVGFRRGAAQLAMFDPNRSAPRTRQAPAPLLDVEVLDAPGDGTEGQLLLATVEGLYRDAAAESSPRIVEGVSEVRELAVVEEEGQRYVVALRSGGELVWLDPALETVRRRASGAPTRVLVAARDPASGFGVAPHGIAASCPGRFLPGAGEQIAVATTSGQLLLLEIATGRELFRASWPEIGELSAADLDGDGRDELVVASARRLTVLHAPGPVSTERRVQP